MGELAGGLKCVYFFNEFVMPPISLAENYVAYTIKRKLNSQYHLSIKTTKAVNNYTNKKHGKNAINLYQPFNGLHVSMGSLSLMTKINFEGPLAGQQGRGQFYLRGMMYQMASDASEKAFLLNLPNESSWVTRPTTCPPPVAVLMEQVDLIGWVQLDVNR